MGRWEGRFSSPIIAPPTRGRGGVHSLEFRRSTSNNDFHNVGRQNPFSFFGEFAVDKGLIQRMGVSGDDRHVPSYAMDWIVTYTAKTQKTTASLERAVQEFVAKHLPATVEICRRRQALWGPGSGGDGADRRNPNAVSTKRPSAIAADLLDGLAALHEHGIVHRDVNPQNILRCDERMEDCGLRHQGNS